MTVHLRIDRLIIDGLPLGPGDAARLQAAVEAELTRLIAEGGLPPALAAGGARARADAPAPLRVDAGLTPEALGTRLAGVIHGGIGS